MKPALNQTWVQETVEFLYGFRLRDFQLDILMQLLNGGIYSIMMPTDFGKSMLLEIAIILGLALDPNSRNIGVKINQEAADTSGKEVARKLLRLSERYPEVEPLCRWMFGDPVVAKGFWVMGARRDSGRDTNPSVCFYGLGSTALQGKRALRTFVDDVERMEEATSVAMSTRLRSRISAVSRTMQDHTLHPNMAWAVFGTPTHASSIHFALAKDLEKIGVRYQEIKITPFREDGSPRWPDRVQKMEVHRRLMDRREFAAAYELSPIGQRQMGEDDLERIFEPLIGVPRDEQQFRSELLALDEKNPLWKAHLSALEFYIGWDPAGTGDWAIAVIAILGETTWVLRTHLGMGDTWDQIEVIRGYLKGFPSSIVIIERNGQQQAFIDLFQQEFPEQMVVPHGTYGNKHSEVVGIPGLMATWQAGKVRLPWADQTESLNEYEVLLDELRAYGVGSHPHVIPAVWFGWYWSRKHEVRSASVNPSDSPLARRMPVVMPALAPVTLPATPTHLRRESQRAWRRRWR